MKMLDLFCCAGGASMGYHRAGFEVVGIDKNPQPNYPFEFVRYRFEDLTVEDLREFDAISAGPPCQGYSLTQRVSFSEEPLLIGPVRELLVGAGVPWIIENVEDARWDMRKPKTLCGAMFGLRTYRHRLFESSFDWSVPEHPQHVAPLRKMGRPVRNGEFMHVVGHFSGMELAREIMGITWTNRHELAEAIPPVYTEYIGKQLMEAIR